MLRRIAMPAPLAALGKRFCLAVEVPSLSDSIKTGQISKLCVNVGDEVVEDQELFEITSEKASLMVLAKKSGVVTSMPQMSQNVTTGETVATIKEGPVSIKAPAAAAAAAPAGAAAPAAATTQAAAPAAPKVEAQSAAAPAAPRKIVVAGAETRVRQEKITPMRRRIAERLKASQNTAAILTTFNEIDMTNLINLREKHKDEFLKRHGVKMGFMSPFAKACATALMEVPIINATFTDEYIEHHDFVDISIAVATKTGLVVPVLRDVQDMTFADIEKKIEDFGTRAKANKLSIEEMTGGTFTISNGGTFGSWMGTPIINPPQSAILGMHAVKKKPWVDEKGNIVVRDIMAVALTYDHRLIDGRDAVTFLVKVKNLIEDPVRIVLGLP